MVALVLHIDRWRQTKKKYCSVLDVYILKKNFSIGCLCVQKLHQNIYIIYNNVFFSFLSFARMGERSRTIHLLGKHTEKYRKMFGEILWIHINNKKEWYWKGIFCFYYCLFLILYVYCLVLLQSSFFCFFFFLFFLLSLSFLFLFYLFYALRLFISIIYMPFISTCFPLESHIDGKCNSYTGIYFTFDKLITTNKKQKTV